MWDNRADADEEKNWNESGRQHDQLGTGLHISDISVEHLGQKLSGGGGYLWVSLGIFGWLWTTAPQRLLLPDRWMIILGRGKKLVGEMCPSSLGD